MGRFGRHNRLGLARNTTEIQWTKLTPDLKYLGFFSTANTNLVGICMVLG